MRSSSGFSFFYLMFIVLPSVAYLPASTSAQSIDEALQIIEQAVQDGRIPGASVLVMQHGKVIEQTSFGVCEIEQGRPFRTDTVCWIASLTKPITAAAAMTINDVVSSNPKPNKSVSVSSSSASLLLPGLLLLP